GAALVLRAGEKPRLLGRGPRPPAPHRGVSRGRQVHRDQHVQVGHDRLAPERLLPAAFLPFLKPYADFVVGRQQAIYYYSVNVARPPLDNVWVRRALDYALDRQTIADKVLKGTRPPWGRFCPSGYPGYEPPEPIPYQPAKAREYLARAGYPGG